MKMHNSAFFPELFFSSQLSILSSPVHCDQKKKKKSLILAITCRLSSEVFNFFLVLTCRFLSMQLILSTVTVFWSSQWEWKEGESLKQTLNYFYFSSFSVIQNLGTFIINDWPSILNRQSWNITLFICPFPLLMHHLYFLFWSLWTTLILHVAQARVSAWVWTSLLLWSLTLNCGLLLNPLIKNKIINNERLN